MDSDDLSDDEKDFDVPEESKISKVLSDKTTRTVVILVLVLLFLLAGCSIDTYTETDIQHKTALKDVVSLYNDKALWEDYKKGYEHIIKTTRGPQNEYPMIYFQAPDPSGKYTDKLFEKTWTNTTDRGIDYKLLRKEEYTAISVNGVYINDKGGMDTI